MLKKLTVIIILGLAHLCLDGVLLSSYAQNDSIVVVKLANNLARFPFQRIDLPFNLTKSLPTNVTIGVWNACLGYSNKIQCWAFHDLGSEFEGSVTTGLDSLGLKVTQLIAPEYIVFADAASTLLLLGFCSFIVMFCLRKAVMWVVMVAAVLFLAPVIFFVIFVYAFRSTLEDLGFDVEVGIAGVFSIIALGCSVLSLLVSLAELLL